MVLDGAGVLRFREEKPPEDILPLWEYNSILKINQQQAIIEIQNEWIRITDSALKRWERAGL